MGRILGLRGNPICCFSTELLVALGMVRTLPFIPTRHSRFALWHNDGGAVHGIVLNGDERLIGLIQREDGDLWPQADLSR